MPYFRKPDLRTENSMFILLFLLLIAAGAFRNGTRIAAANTRAQAAETTLVANTSAPVQELEDVVEVTEPLDSAQAEPFEPDSMRFYTMNDYFVDGTVTVTNAYGESVSGNMPGYGSGGFWDSHDIMLPSPGRLNDGYTVTIQSHRDVPPVSFHTTAVGDPRFRPHNTTYLLITGCPNAYLWPKMFVNWAEVEVYPTGREAPATCGY